MPATDSPATLVARFLKANHYSLTLNAFISEAGLEPEAGTIDRGDLTIEQVLEEKKIFDLSVRYEKFGVGDEDKGWRLPAPSTPKIVSTLPTSANLLHVSVEQSRGPSHGVGAGSWSIPRELLLATTADRRLLLLQADETFALVQSISDHEAPILSLVTVGAHRRQTIVASMSGQVVLYNDRLVRLAERRDHKKYVVKLATWEETTSPALLATAGWDGKIFLYELVRDGSESQGYDGLGSPIAEITLPTNPETILFVKDPDSNDLYLIVTRRDSTSLHYYKYYDNHPYKLQSRLVHAGSQNLAPHSNAWIAFSPSSIALCPTDPTLLAVATSALPHMKLILVRLLFPKAHPSPSTAPANQAAQTRENLATQDREEAAIQLHVNTLAPQTPYSTPQVCWRPDGSGVWVNGDDGVVRGVEAKTGKVVSFLKDGHEAGSKIRAIWAGWVGEESKKEEWIVSGGFDRRLVVWMVGNGGSEGEKQNR